jgi:hypothetical protein
MEQRSKSVANYIGATQHGQCKAGFNARLGGGVSIAKGQTAADILADWQDYEAKPTRICSVTGEEMTEGYVWDDGEAYFKHEHDALSHCIACGYDSIEEAWDDNVIYWTEFK